MQINKKHLPVMLKEVLSIFDDLIHKKEYITAIDCTLGQGGHSMAIYEKMNKGILLSIEKHKKTFDWVRKYYGFNNKNEISDSSKKWKIINDDYTNLDRILFLNNLKNFDFLLADLGISNFQLSQNLGISYSLKHQILDMRYLEEGIPAYEVLNKFDGNTLIDIMVNLGQIKRHLASLIVKDIINFRKDNKFFKVADLYNLAIKYKKGNVIKLFQALRSFVNNEEVKLRQLISLIKRFQAKDGVSLIITFNSLEEKIVKDELRVNEILEPNIFEIIENAQARTAKLHKYKI